MGIKYDIGICQDCGKRRKVKHREWIRKNRPRCLDCGGYLVHSRSANSDHIDHNDNLIKPSVERTGRSVWS